MSCLNYFSRIKTDAVILDLDGKPRSILPYTDPCMLRLCVAYSRILDGQEVVVAANTSTTNEWRGEVIVDVALNQVGDSCTIIYSNLGTTGTTPVRAVREYNCGSGS